MAAGGSEAVPTHVRASDRRVAPQKSVLRSSSLQPPAITIPFSRNPATRAASVAGTTGVQRRTFTPIRPGASQSLSRRLSPGLRRGASRARSMELL